MMGMPSCREVTRAITAGELEKAPFRQRLGLRLHVMLCRHCRRYARQIRAIGMAAREILRRPIGADESLERLRAALLSRIEPSESD